MNNARLTELTYEASRLRPMRYSDPRLQHLDASGCHQTSVFASRNGRFRCVRNRYALQGEPHLWTMTDTREGKVYTTRTDSLVGHYKAVKSTIRFEAEQLEGSAA